MENKYNELIAWSFYRIKAITIVLVLLLVLILPACNKMVDVPQPINTITTTETFSTASTATSAITAIYSDMSLGQSESNYAAGGTTLFAGQAADELEQFGGTSTYMSNTIQSNDGIINSFFWQPIYFDIYLANSVIEGVQTSTTLTPALKNQLTGEAKFIRAFCHFYLVNLFGDVPLVTSTSFAANSLATRTPSKDVYQQIIADLKDAQSLLPGDYSVSGGKRVRANQWAATALLARAYLYTGDYTDAAIQASAVINNSATYSLVSDLNKVFLANSSEAILQLMPVSTTSQYATPEGNQFIPTSTTASPNYYLTPQLLGAFETNDQRKTAWLGTTTYSGTTYYYPYKYKVQNLTSGTNITEYYMVLRLAEQYLIRAEAEANGANGGTAAAIADLNVIRARAGLAVLPSNLTQTQAQAAVLQERRIELMCEWGHRWLDLKRAGSATAAAALSSIPYKPTWNQNYLLWPIPSLEIANDYKLIQNPGY